MASGAPSRAARLAREALVGTCLGALSLALVLVAAEVAFRLKGTGEPSRWYLPRSESGSQEGPATAPAHAGAKEGVQHGEGDLIETVRYQPTPRLPLRLASATFSARKPAGTARIFFLGDSTVFGYPYGPRGTPSKALESLLAAAFPERSFEVINAGFLGADSARVLSLLRELVEFEPDTFVAYVGHNEFLRYDYAHQVDVHFRFHPSVPLSPSLRAFVALHESALWRWACGTDLGLAVRGWWQQRQTGQRIGRSGSVDGELMEATFRSYGANLAEMARICRARGVPLVLCTVVANARSQPPLLRRHSRSLPEDARRDNERALQAAQQALDGGRASEALAEASRVAVRDTADPLPEYLRGQAFLAAGEVQGARGALEAAIEKDGLRHRAFARISETVRRVTREEGVVLCDVQAAFEEASHYGIIGDDLIVDHVHPSLKGMVLLARTVARSLADAGIVPPRPVEQAPLSDDELVARLGMDREASRDAMLRLALSAAGQANPARAASLFLIAATLYGPDETDAETAPLFLRGVAALLQGDEVRARGMLESVKSLDPAVFERLTSRFAQLRIEERIR